MRAAATTRDTTRSAPVLLGVVALAAAVPIVWAEVVFTSDQDRVVVPLIVFASCLYWTIALALLVRIRSAARAASLGLALGTLSPLLAPLLLALLLAPLLPVLLLAPASGWFFLLLASPGFIASQWLLFVPVGIAMGLLVAGLTRFVRRPAAGPEPR